MKLRQTLMTILSLLFLVIFQNCSSSGGGGGGSSSVSEDISAATGGAISGVLSGVGTVTANIPANSLSTDTKVTLATTSSIADKNASSSSLTAAGTAIQIIPENTSASILNPFSLSLVLNNVSSKLTAQSTCTASQIKIFFLSAYYEHGSSTPILAEESTQLSTTVSGNTISVQLSSWGTLQAFCGSADVSYKISVNGATAIQITASANPTPEQSRDPYANVICIHDTGYSYYLHFNALGNFFGLNEYPVQNTTYQNIRSDEQTQQIFGHVVYPLSNESYSYMVSDIDNTTALTYTNTTGPIFTGTFSGKIYHEDGVQYVEISEGQFSLPACAVTP